MSRSEALKFETCYQIKFDTVIRGYHLFKRIWTPIMKEKLQCFKDTREEANDYDKYAIGVYRELKTEQIETEKERILVGHIPIEISTSLMLTRVTNYG